MAARPQPSDVEIVASGLEFTEGPIWCANGDLIVMEIAAGRVSRVRGGKTSVIATPGGSPNGAAIGPDGRVYVCNSGGFNRIEMDDLLFVDGTPDDYSGGRIERLDPASGAVEVLYTECDGHPLRGPNDIVFDSTGGFWFTDMGKVRERSLDRGGIYYARPDGSAIREVLFPLMSPNGIALSADEGTLYFTETFGARVWAVPLVGPGETGPIDNPLVPGRVLYSPVGPELYDSMAIDASGNLVIGTLLTGGVTVVNPATSEAHVIATPDAMCTNVCFGGADFATAFVTLASTGRVGAIPWPVPGQPLAFSL